MSYRANAAYQVMEWGIAVAAWGFALLTFVAVFGLIALFVTECVNAAPSRLPPHLR